MAEPVHYRRYAKQCLTEALEDSPVMLIHGPRQCGKTTLAREVGDRLNYLYVSFDDDNVRTAALADPAGFVADLPERTILDEVQRVPSLFTALKIAVDRKRDPGRFLLTGSANVLLVPKLSDSLAGRIQFLRLYPLAQCELAGHAPAFLDVLFRGGFRTRIRQTERLRGELYERIVSGGFPAALARPAESRRTNWYRSYLEALVQRDVRDFSRISSLKDLSQLLSLAAAQTARLLNITDLGRELQLSRPTINNYVTLLEQVFLLEMLPPWHSNLRSRLVKTPKLHLGDSGLACTLLGTTEAGLAADRTLLGQLLETFVFQELRRQASWRDEPIKFFHFRDRDGAEVDIVMERGAHELVGVEVKASATVTLRDFSGMNKLRDAAAKRFVAGVVLYDGEITTSFGEGFFAVPIRALWETNWP